MSQCLYMRPSPHTFPMSKPFAHLDAAAASSPRTSTKRKLPFPEAPSGSPPAQRQRRLTQESTSATPRLNPNPYSADQMATLPQPQQPSLQSRPLLDQGPQSLPTLRDILPEFNSYYAQSSPASTVTQSKQFGGPETFQPSGPTKRPAATGFAPSPVTVPRQSTYSGSERISFQEDRQYAHSAPAASRNTTTRNSPIQSLSRPPSHRTENIRALPPLGPTLAASEPSRTGAFPPYLASLPPPPPPSAPYPGPVPAQHAPSHYGAPALSSPYALPGPSQAPNTSPGYSHFDNADYNSDGKSRRRRGNLPKTVTDTLRKWFNEHISHPYPTEDEKMMLMAATGLTMSQISNWFINARRRSLPQMPREGPNMGSPMDAPGAYPGPQP